MPYAPSRGARIFYEESGSGTPIIFVHEFAGDHRSWDDQMRHFGRGWRCLTMAARGYPPSDVPDDPAQYGQGFFTDDVVAVLDAAGIERAHVVGLSMGGYAALMVGLKYPQRVLSVVAAGAGSGAFKATRETYIADTLANADVFEQRGIDGEAMASGGTRIQLKLKDEIAWRRFVQHVSEHPGHAAAKTLRAVQAGRPSLYDLEADLRASGVPTLLVVGDEDEACLDVNLWMKRVMPAAKLVILPGTGHAINLEEPGLFNAFVERFIVSVDLGRWRPRDGRAIGGNGLVPTITAKRRG